MTNTEGWPVFLSGLILTLSVSVCQEMSLWASPSLHFSSSGLMLLYFSSSETDSNISSRQKSVCIVPHLSPTASNLLPHPVQSTELISGPYPLHFYPLWWCICSAFSYLYCCKALMLPVFLFFHLSASQLSLQNANLIRSHCKPFSDSSLPSG